MVGLIQVLSQPEARCDELSQSRCSHAGELGDNLYNWQFYIQESKAREEEKNKKKSDVVEDVLISG
jgi:hypothetical protein